MEKGDQKISILLDGGLADRRAPELRAPIVEHMAAPALARSDNTRFSAVRGSAVRAPDAPAIGTGLPAACHGIVPGGNQESTALLFRGLQRVAMGFNIVHSEAFNLCTIPARVLGGGSNRHQWSGADACVQTHNTTGRVWRISLTYVISTNTQFWVSASEPDDVAAKRARPLFNSPPASVARWVSMTSHGQSTGFDVMMAWYVVTSGGAPGLYMTRMEHQPNSVSGQIGASPAVLVLTPASAGVWYDVKRLDDNNVIIVTGHPVTTSTIRITKYNVNTAAVTNVDIAGAGTVFECAVAVETVSGALNVAVAIASTTALTIRTFLYDGNLTPIWGPTTNPIATACTRIGVGINKLPETTSSVIVVHEHAAASFSSGTAAGMICIFDAYNLASGAYASGSAQLTTRPWKRLLNTGTQLKWSAEEFTPAFLMCTAYSPSNVTAADVDYVDDPALEIWTGSSLFSDDFGPIGRVGVVRGSFSPFDGNRVSDRPSSSACAAYGTKLYVDYRTTVSRTDPAGLPENAVNATALEFASEPLFFAADRNGLTIVAGALPFQWDGHELLEFGIPLSRPHVRVDDTGTGSAFAAGTYSAVVVYSWIDKTGTRHRSRPSNVVSFTSPTIDTPALWAPASNGFTRKISRLAAINRDAIEIEAYITPLNVPSFHRADTAFAVSLNPSEKLSPLAATTTAQPILYSTGAQGQELLPQPPPPLRDVAIVGARAWGVDAEYPYRIVYSKLRVGGYGYEFHPALDVLLPSTGGEAQRVFEVSGTTVVLCERSVWQISGLGPDNAGNGGSFSAPIKLSDYGSAEPHSACAFPGGVIWGSKDRWYLMRGGAVEQIQDVRVGMTITHAACFKDQDEIAFYGTLTSLDPGESFGPSIAKVYNYSTGRWSRWEARAYTHLATSPNEARRHYAYSGTTLYRVDAETFADDASMVFETDWISLSGDFHDHNILRDVIYSGQRVGAHGVTVDVFTDHNLTATTSRTWADAEITALMTDASTAPWYSLSLEPVQQDTRCVKVRVTLTVDGTAEGGRPQSLTIVYKLLTPLREEAFVAGSRK